MAGQLRGMAGLARAAAVTAAVVSACAFGAGQVPAAAGTPSWARPAGGELYAISCTARYCAAVGVLSFPHAYRPLVVSEENGTWGRARTVPGLAALPGGEQYAALRAVSCSSKGNCGAGGLYQEKGGRDAPLQPFVVTERHGVWGRAKAVPGLAALGVGGRVEWISCRSWGACTVTGTYTPDGYRVGQVFAVSERHGRWGTAGPIPGLFAADHGLATTDTALSCVSPGNCTTGGRYGTEAGYTGYKAFAAVQKNGVWGTVHTFPAIAPGVENASIDQLSCQRGGDCTGTGTYYTSSPGTYVFAVRETRGSWDAGQRIRGASGMDTSLSCSSPGDCTLVGNLGVAVETHGKWGRARAFPGKPGILTGVACFAAGDCTAAGIYFIRTRSRLVGAIFVIAEKHGRWGKRERVPGSAGLSKYIIHLTLSCGAPRGCAVGGSYSGRHEEPYVAAEKGNGTWGKAERVRGITP